MIADWITAGFILSGALFALIAALGIVRLPDIFIRMHASTKAGTLGCGLILVGLVVQSGGETAVIARALAAIVFLFLTAPVAAHMIGRAAYLAGDKLDERSIIDEMDDEAKAVRNETTERAD